MSRATGGARPWNESEGRVGQRHLPRPPTSALIDAPRQSKFRLRASFFAAIITTAATPNSHPDCRALLIQIVALQLGLGDVHPAELGLPIVQRRFRDAMLPRQIGSFRTCLMLTQHANNLLFRKPGSLHLSVLQKAGL